MRFITLLLMGCVSLQATAADINVPADHLTIQAAIGAASNGDVVIVAAGTYPESINFLGKAITVRSADPNNKTIVMRTIIDGTGFDHVVVCETSEGSDSVLSGFVITGGDANGASFPDDVGGGMLNFGAVSPTVTNCSFIGNSADTNGGGMYNTLGSFPTVTNCLFSNNTAVEGGGGMANIGNPVVTNCSFNGNTAEEGGGGMFNFENIAFVVNCSFSGNSTGVSGGPNEIGGGMLNFEANPVIQHCSFSGNTADRGGGMANSQESPTMFNCSFSGNTAVISGGGMYNDNLTIGNPSVIQCTFDQNTAAAPGSGGGMFNVGGTGPSVDFTGFCNNAPDQIIGPFTGSLNSLAFCAPPIPTPDPCPADINDDTNVNVTDLLTLLGAWGACP